MAVGFAERAFRLQELESIKPSMTISESAGTSRSLVMQRTVLIGSPSSAPATPISSKSMASFCGPVKKITGAQPITMATGIGSPRF